MESRRRRAFCAVFALIALGVTASCGSGQSGSAPAVPAASALIMRATSQYVAGPGADVGAIDRMVADVLAHHNSAVCQTDVQKLAGLGNPEEVGTTLAGTPDPQLAELLADELSNLGEVLASCEKGALASGDFHQLTLIHNTIDQRLKKDGAQS